MSFSVINFETNGYQTFTLAARDERGLLPGCPVDLPYKLRESAVTKARATGEVEKAVLL